MNSKAKKKPGSIVLSIISVILAAIFMTPILWSLAVSFQKEGKQINSILDWFTPPYTFQNYPDLILGSDVTKWLFNSVFIAVLTTVLFSSGIDGAGGSNHCTSFYHGKRPESH